jgi:hypothetical protein
MTDRPPREDINQAIDAGSYSRTAFPSTESSHAMMIQFVPYSFSGLSSGDFVGSPVGGARATILLPIPSNLEDSFNINVDRLELGAVGRVAVDYFSKQTDAEIGEFFSNMGTNLYNGGDNLANFGRGILSAIQNSEEGIGDMLNSYISSMSGGDASQIAAYLAKSGVSRIPKVGFAAEVSGRGTSINPHVTLNFDGVGLKDHSFSWSLSPNSPQDTENLREISNTIKREILPKYAALGGASGGGILDRAILEYPSIANVHLIGLDTEYYYKFKPCMVSNFSANFTPNGPSVLKNGNPTAVTFSLQLKEAQIHTKDDYE